MWWEKYENIPFMEKGRDFNGWDCWGVPFLIFKNERGIDLPDYLTVYDHTGEKEKLSGVIAAEKKKDWSLTLTPAAFDLVLLRMRGLPMHVGVVTKPGFMLHCMEEVNTTHVQYSAMKWKQKIMGFYRYTGPGADG